MTRRITWIEGRAFLQEAGPGQMWADARIVRPATDADRADMNAGRIQYDPETHPASLAWAEHVRRGGD